MTRHVVEATKSAIKRGANPPPPAPHSSKHVVSPKGRGDGEGHTIWAAGLPFPPTAVREGRWDDWLAAGMAATLRQYERLPMMLDGVHPKPTVILLYNPTPYEVYRGVWIDRDPESDRSLAWTRDSLIAFARAHRWQFLDLTKPLRHAVEARQAWLFGRDDITHWSPEGSAIVGEVLADELLTMIGPRVGGGRKAN